MNKIPIYQAQSVFSKIRIKVNQFFSLIYKEYNKDSYYQYRIFQIFLYGWVISQTIFLLAGHEYFWGKYSFIQDIQESELENPSFTYQLLHLLSNPWFSNYYLIFIGLQIFFSLLIIFNIYPRVSALFVFILTMNLDYKIHTSTDGGNNLIHLLLFYSIFFYSKKESTLNQSHFIKLLSHYMGKASFFMARIQVCLVYLIAGHLKLSGELWAKGVALYYTFNVDEFTHPFLQNLVTQFPSVSVVGSYTTLAFQLIFPFFIWFPKARPALILFGTFIHLGISFGMGLLFFGLAMIVAYTIFYTNEKAKALFFSLTFKNSILVGIDENCKICNLFKKFVSFFDWFKNITFDKARKPENKLLLDIDEEKRTNKIFVYDYGQNLYFSGMKGIEVILKNSCLKPFYPFLLILNFLGIGEWIYEKIFVDGPLRKRCSEEKCDF